MRWASLSQRKLDSLPCAQGKHGDTSVVPGARWLHHPRIQVTEDRELSRALRAAVPHLAPGLSRSRQVRELAIAGARQLADGPRSEERRRELVERRRELWSAWRRTSSTLRPAPWDSEVLRDAKRRAWRFGTTPTTRSPRSWSSSRPGSHRLVRCHRAYDWRSRRGPAIAARRAVVRTSRGNHSANLTEF
jgi:hypothetical protein